MSDFYITIPKIILDRINWSENNVIEIEIKDNSIYIIRKEK